MEKYLGKITDKEKTRCIKAYEEVRDKIQEELAFGPKMGHKITILPPIVDPLMVFNQ